MKIVLKQTETSSDESISGFKISLLFSNTHFAIRVGHHVGTHSDFMHDVTMKIKLSL